MNSYIPLLYTASLYCQYLLLTVNFFRNPDSDNILIMESGLDTSAIPKRFVLPEQDFAKNRLAIVHQEVKQFQKEHPEVLSLCLFGSLTTGHSRPESDIDGYLFVDAEQIAAAGNIDQSSILKTIHTEYYESASPTTYFTEPVVAKYTYPFRERLKSKLGLTDEQVKHVRSRPISKDIIDQHVEKIVDQINALKKYRENIEEWELNDPHDNQASTPEDIEAYWKYQPKHPPFPTSATNLSAMFHLDLGGGITKYRQYLIEKLTQMEEVGQQVWTTIIEDTEMMEQHLDTNTEIHYPRTLADAYQTYYPKQS